jgi:hydroxymethylpyrimidine pyrophosphatase-like HAD family hydrolase
VTAECLPSTKSAFVFDIDNTLTPPRRQLEREMADALRWLKVPFALAAGSDLPLLEHQFFGPLHSFGFRGIFDAFVCNGAARYRCAYDDLTFRCECIDDFSFEKELGKEAYAKLLCVLRQALDLDQFRLPSFLEVIGNQILERGSMVNFAPIGRPTGVLSASERANRDAFVPFDRTSGFREGLLAYLRERVDRDLPGNNIFIALGGQTSFDIGMRGRDKSYAVRRLLAEGFPHVTYVGDALYRGGNDVAVLDFQVSLGTDRNKLTVVQVDGCQETLQLLRNPSLSFEPVSPPYTGSVCSR